MNHYVKIAGACKGGSVPIGVPNATTTDACKRACSASATCVSAGWWQEGRTSFNGMRSQCWLSATCAVPNCCTRGFYSFTKRESPDSAAAVEPPPRPVQFDPSALPPKRLLIVHFLTLHVLDEYLKNWRQLHELLYSQHTSSSILMAAPHAALHRVLTAIVQRGCSWHDPGDHDCEAVATIDNGGSHHDFFMQRVDNDGHALIFGPFYRWRLGGVEYLFVGVVVEPPQGWYDALGRSDAPGATSPFDGSATCAGRSWSYNYCMYSGAVFSYHVFKLPLLARYGAMLKVDSDIVFRRPLPFDVGAELAAQPRVSIAHTGLQTAEAVREGAANLCNRGIFEALEAFLRDNAHTQPGRRWNASRAPSVALSGHRQWCARDKLGHEYFYGNFVAFTTSFVRNERVQALASFLYHDSWSGYFRSRWTDQAAYVAFACLALDVPALTPSTEGGVSPVWFMKGLRHHAFEHARDDAFRTHTHTGAATNESEVALRTPLRVVRKGARANKAGSHVAAA